jgi:hypothetical protein
MPGSSIMRRWQNHQAKFGEINADILWALAGVDSDIAWAGVDGNVNWSGRDMSNAVRLGQGGGARVTGG